MTDPKSTSALAIAKTIPKRMNRHNDQLACAGIAFFGTLALVPTLIAMVSIYGLVASEDDVADTVHTLRLVRDVLVQHVAEARTAVLYHKSQSVIAPDYSWKQTDAWINFPWSVLPPVAEVEQAS